jgi:uncharacterized glyoxalase superfamily metalloenzyme YdcJ
MSTAKRLVTWQLRAQFAAGLSAMYAGEVPAYATLVEVSGQVNADYVARHPGAERLGTVARVTAERHGAIRVGGPAELAAVAELFAAFGMFPVGYYDLRSARSPVPVVSTAFRPVEANELAHNPFRVFTSMLATRDRRYFDPDLRARVETFVERRQLFDPALLARARMIAAEGACDVDEAAAFVGAAVSAFALSREPINKHWYEELSRVSPVAADIAGVCSTHINHLTPRVLDIDELYGRMTERGITMIDAIQGPPGTDGPAVLLRQTSFRALAEPCLFRSRDGSVAKGTLRVRFGEVEARGVALTPRGRERYDAAMAASNPASVWSRYFPSTDDEMAADGLAYYRGGDPSAPIVYEDFLPASAAGIFRSNLDRDTRAGCDTGEDHDDSGYDAEWLAGAIGHDIHDPYALYEALSQVGAPPACGGVPQ